MDYRYNIRGWLTHINNAQVSTQAATNDDTNDLFGMELLYNETDANLSNTALYNGNISATKWSSPLGLGTVKEKGYTYSYDQLNRIKTSVFKEKTTTWTTPANSGFQETGFNYDLNGNITTLQRNDKRTTGWMDNLAYIYTGNQLQRVTDTGDDYAGFMDGQPGTGNDYTYDANGNMTRDLNKGIGASLTDATSLISYNHLNLPETVTKGINSVRYMYDASGRKLAQTTTFGTRAKTTDYAGEFVYEDDALQFINHEEGRIAIAANKTMVIHDGEVVTGITAVTSTLAPITQNSDQKYIRATAVGTTTKQGMFPIGGTLTVTAGERYLIRAKGYRTANNTNQVHLYIRTNGTDLNWPGAQLPRGTASATNESYVEQIITVPVGHTTLQAGVVWNTVAAGEQFFLNDFEITKLTTNTTPEYQYNLKDHLGNVRLSFTSKEETLNETATLETANLNVEQSKFLRIQEAKRINSSLFDRTNGVTPTTTPGYAQRLNGSTNEKYGLAKSISVMPGDVINAEVYAKYADTNMANWNTAFTALMSQIAANTAGVVVDGATYSTSTASFPPNILGNQTTTDNGAPRAYLNWLVFDRNYVYITGGFKQISTVARETGSDIAHEKLQMPSPITITQPGYVYIYLSNENTTPVEVFFDELTVTHTKSPVIQMDDYYAFGLRTSNSYSRENSVPNRLTYNGKEEQDELDLGWLDYGARMYRPELGRFSTIDPHSDSYFAWNPYNYVANNPILLVDPDGRDWVVNKTEKDGKTNYDITFQAALVNNSKSVTMEDIVNLAVNLSNQIQDAFTIDEDGVTTSVNVELRVAKDGKAKDNEHVINVTDDLDSNEAGRAEIGSREIKINSAQVWQINGGGKDNDKTTGPHEAGHTAGLVHPDEISWFNMWSWGDRDQIIPEGTDNDNLMYSGPYRQYTLDQDLNNGGKGYKINRNQAEIIYKNRDNKPKKKN